MGFFTGTQIYQASVTLTDAQIKALPSTPIEIIPAPGAGRVLVSVSGLFILDSSAGAYTGVTDASLALYWDGTAQIQSSLIKSEVDLSNAGIVLMQLPCSYAQVFTSGVPFQNFYNQLLGGTYALSDVANKNICVADAWNGLSDYGGGNVANTLQVIVSYLVIDV